ncbi:MAG: MBL fold metallo-hydrolase [Chloroflexi bacterium]|nr:MBL fold metallo-hydrolase [Chloroflexota bacterium]
MMLNPKMFRPSLWLTELELPEFAVRGAVIIGQHRAVVWDTLSHPRDMALVRPLLDNKELIIVYSHADWDHVWGTVGLDYGEEPIVAQAECLARFSTDAPVTLQKKQTTEPGVWDEVVLVTPTLTFQAEYALDLGGVTLTLQHLPGHTEDCIVGFIPEWGILLAGDTIETPFPIIPRDSPLDQWIMALQKWAQDERVQTVIPAHGPIADRTLIERNLAYLQAIRDHQAIQPPTNLDDFYQETHDGNLQWRGPEG